MNSDHDRPQGRDAELAERLWRLVSAVQAITDRLLAQAEKSARGNAPDPYSLAALAQP